MKLLISSTLFVIVMFFFSCQKDCIIFLPPSPPVPPDTGFRVLDVLPAEPSTICITSYQDLVNALGSNKVYLKSVELQSGTVVTVNRNTIAYIQYEAVNSQDGNSLFHSRLLCEWRDPGAYWQLSTSDVWSLGCTLTGGQAPYTNIVKDSQTILINTSFTWGASPYTGERVKSLNVE